MASLLPAEDQAFLLLRRTVSGLVAMGDAEWELLRGIFRPQRLEASAVRHSPEAAPPPVLFLASGLLRHFHADEDGSVSKAFLQEGMFSPIPEGCPLAPRGRCGAQALEDSLVLVADGAAWTALYDRHPVFDRLGRKLAAAWMSRKEAETRSFQLQDAKGRYLSFLRLYPGLAQRVPQYHIASYLGITGVSLSRVRRALARRPAPAPVPA